MKTPLFEWHKSHGITLQDFAGWELPERFSDPLEEYQAVRQRAGLLDLSFRAKVQVSGEDRVAFLQGMVSNDIKRLKTGEGCYTTMLTEQGRIVADFRVYALPDTFLVDVDARIREKWLDTLSRFIIADDVELEDISAQWVTFSLQGPYASSVLERAVGEPLSLAQEYQHREVKIQDIAARDVAVRIVKVSDTGEEGYEVFVSSGTAEKTWQILLDAGESLGLKPVGMTALNMLRVEGGIPWYGTDMDESRIVLEVGLQNAISYDKGCYLGQEVVERATARGHINRRLTGLLIRDKTVPRPGDKLFHDSQEIGWITSAVFSPHLGCPVSLAYVRREYLTPGTQVRIDRQGKTMIAEVAHLPFYQQQKNTC
jgi:glycine cleavage system T protein